MNSNAQIKLENDRLMVSGDLDFFSVMNVWKESLPLLKKSSTWCFDFSQVKSSNSAALALIIEWIKHARCDDRAITFKDIPPQLSSIASVCGLGIILK